MSEWRLAKSLETFRSQQNKAAPDRSKASDGTIASAQHHAANPDSDHEPNEHDVVQAFDDTDDPAHGADMDKLAERIRRDRDKRVKYVIDNKRMFSSYTAHGVPAWTWRAYTGADPHTGHLHISVVDDPKLYDDPRPWACFEEDDMPLSRDDLDAIEARFEKWWASKTFTPPGEAGTDEKTYRDSALRHIWAIGVRVERKIDAWIKAHP